MAKKPGAKKVSEGKGLLMNPKNMSSKKGKGLMSARGSQSKRRFGETAAEGSIRNAITNQKAGVTTQVGNLINDQIESQGSSNPYAGVVEPGMSDVVNVNDRAFGRGGYDDVVASQYQNALKNNEATWRQQSEDFEQMAAERGWTPGSEVYNSQKANLQKGQAQEKANLYAQAQGLGMQGQSLGIEGESARVSANRGRFTDLGSLQDRQIGLNNSRRNLSASDAAVLQGMTDPQFSQYAAQPFQYEMAKLGPEATKYAAGAGASGAVQSAGIYAGAQKETTAMNNDAALARLQYEQRTGMRYGG